MRWKVLDQGRHKKGELCLPNNPKGMLLPQPLPQITAFHFFSPFALFSILSSSLPFIFACFSLSRKQNSKLNNHSFYPVQQNKCSQLFLHDLIIVGSKYNLFFWEKQSSKQKNQKQGFRLVSSFLWKERRRFVQGRNWEAMCGWTWQAL